MRSVLASEFRVADQRHLVGTLVLLAVALTVLEAHVVLAGWPGADSRPALEQSVALALGDDSGGRVVRASMTDWGDLTVELNLGDVGGAQANRAAALADVLRIARAAYQGGYPPPVNVTVLGRAAPGTLPILYASLPADRLFGLDWTRVRAEDLASLGDVRWLPSGLCQAWHECAS